MTTNSGQQLTCTNLGCGQRYWEDRNDGLTSQCVYHPGEALFHDGYKRWTCCQQKSTDFTIFLGLKGCKTGKHSNVERVMNIEKKAEKSGENVVNKEECDSSECKEFVFNANDWKELALNETKTVLMANNAPNDQKVVTICKKCHKTVDRSDGTDRTDTDVCVYHCGQTIFHETLKYWTCCPHKKFTDFDDFQQFKGCQTSAGHEIEVQLPKPRIDWFQTNDSINIVLYSLTGVRKDNGSRAETNGRQLKTSLCDKNGLELFAKEWNLKDFIDSEESKVVIDKSKVELRLKKVVKNNYWTELE